MRARELDSRLRGMIDACEWEAALEEVRRQMDEEHYENTALCRRVLEHASLNAAELEAQGSGGAWCLLGEASRWGVGGVPHSQRAWFRCVSEGAALGHALCMRWKGCALHWGTGVPKKDPDAAYRCWIQAARLGCQESYTCAARAFGHGRGVPRSLARAVKWYQRAGSPEYKELLSRHPLRCTPFGWWRADAALQARVAPQVARAQRCWLLCAKRLRVVHGVALMVVEYVCTESGWKKKKTS